MERKALVTARRYLRSVPPHRDHDAVIGEALAAVAFAAHDYDPSRGAKFETHAFTRVRWALCEEMRRQDHVSRDRRKELQAGAEETEADRLPASWEDLWISEDGVEWWEPPDPDELPQDRALRLDEAERLWSAVAELPRQYATAIWLYFGEGLTYREIGRGLGVSETRVHQIVREQALPRLRAALEGV